MLLRKLTWLSLNSSRVCDLGVREVGQGALEGLGVRVGDAAVHLHERIEVLRLVVVRVERLAREGDVAERRSTGGRIEDALDRQLQPLAGRRRDRDRRADGQVVVLGEPVVDEGAACAELGEHRLRAVLPLEVDSAALFGVTAVTEDGSP